MSEINKDFDGVSWEWRGNTFIDLKPICPDCKMELEIKMIDTMIMPKPTKDGRGIIEITTAHVIYKCPKCPFSIDTTIENVDSPKDLLKVVRKEFEHRQRLKASEKKK